MVNSSIFIREDHSFRGVYALTVDRSNASHDISIISSAASVGIVVSAHIWANVVNMRNHMNAAMLGIPDPLSFPVTPPMQF